MAARMYRFGYFPGNADDKKDYAGGFQVKADCLYTKEHPFGFVTEKNREECEELQVADINSAFMPWYWLNGTELTCMKEDESGCFIKSEDRIPLIFKCDVEHSGNYYLTITISGGKDGIKDVMIFSQRRRLLARVAQIAANTVYQRTFTINVCDIIPRGKTCAYEDKTIDVAVVADRPVLSEITIEEADVRTIYIAGDSTVTEQSGCYPYQPGCCYSGWSQMLPLYLNNGIAVSGHAHSGLTTESFRSERHYDIVKKHIKSGDYYFLQFGHNDQKLPHLSAAGGYRDNIIRYINEMREIGAIPVIVTPLARNTWKADGSYNDLLAEFAEECFNIGEELKVPVLDLHGRSMEFIKKLGLEEAKNYFYPKDYTHSNDYGAYLFAEFIIEECRRVELEGVTEWIKGSDGEFLPAGPNELPKPPSEYEGTVTESSLPDQIDREQEIITRAEVLDWIIKTVHFVPTNVYNDAYEDVVGHEWYAGVVEAATQNDIVAKEYLAPGHFYPNEPVTWEQLMSFLTRAYRCRKAVGALPDLLTEKTMNGPVKRCVALAFLRKFEQCI